MNEQFDFEKIEDYRKTREALTRDCREDHALKRIGFMFDKELFDFQKKLRKRDFFKDKQDV